MLVSFGTSVSVCLSVCLVLQLLQLVRTPPAYVQIELWVEDGNDGGGGRANVKSHIVHHVCACVELHACVGAKYYMAFK